MTNHLNDLEKEVVIFNEVNNADLKILRVLNDEVTFVELESSISDEKLFQFGIQFGFSNRKKDIEGRI